MNAHQKLRRSMETGQVKLIRRTPSDTQDPKYSNADFQGFEQEVAEIEARERDLRISPWRDQVARVKDAAHKRHEAASRLNGSPELRAQLIGDAVCLLMLAKHILSGRFYAAANYYLQLDGNLQDEIPSDLRRQLDSMLEILPRDETQTAKPGEIDAD